MPRQSFLPTKLPSLGLSRPARITFMVSSVSIGLIILLATYFRRRRRKPYKDITPELSPDRRVEPIGGNFSANNGEPRSFNGDLLYRQSPGMDRYSKSLSVSSTSIDTDCTMTGSTRLTGEHLMHDLSHFSPGQLCDLGLESLHIMIKYWEEAVTNMDSKEKEDAPIDPSMDELRRQLPELLERAYRIRESFQRHLFHQVSNQAAFESAINVIHEMDRDFNSRQRAQSIRSSSDTESFVSAIDIADLSDLDEQKDAFPHLVLYEAALLELEHGTVDCRTLRTKMVGCSSDTEFLAKLHCIRLALQEVFSESKVRKWFAESGKKLMSKIMVVADRDPEEFHQAFEDMLTFVHNKENWEKMNEELRGRGVKMMTFYDVVVDFIIFDAFDDLESPPSSVTTVVQNRWLSNGFKETALSTAVWSVLKAKRRLLRVPDGFIAHFYAISEQTSPVFAWGFLGPDGPLKEICNFFKDQMLGFMQDIFSFEKVRFTSIEHLAADIHKLARLRYELLAVQLKV